MAGPSGLWGSCAIVLNGQALLNSSCGDAINGYDTVIRFNSAPVGGYEADVGDRTDVMIMNWVKVKCWMNGVTIEETYRGPWPSCERVATSKVDSVSCAHSGANASSVGSGLCGANASVGDQSGHVRSSDVGSISGTDGTPSSRISTSTNLAAASGPFLKDPRPGVVILTDDFQGPEKRNADCAKVANGSWPSSVIDGSQHVIIDSYKQRGLPAVSVDHMHFYSVKAMVRELGASLGLPVADDMSPSGGFRGIFMALQFCRTMAIFGLGRGASDGHYFSPKSRMWEKHPIRVESEVLHVWDQQGFVKVEVYDSPPTGECPAQLSAKKHSSLSVPLNSWDWKAAVWIFVPAADGYLAVRALIDVVEAE
eukprot:jgi/Mesvir1/27011/Mv20718-RA.1